MVVLAVDDVPRSRLARRWQRLQIAIATNLLLPISAERSSS